MRYMLLLGPAIAGLDLDANCRIFQGIAAEDVIAHVFHDRGMTEFRLELNEGHEAKPYCVQYRETDLEFVHRLIAEEGMFCYFEHEQQRHTVVFYPPIPGADPRGRGVAFEYLFLVGPGTGPYSIRVSGRRVIAVCRQPRSRCRIGLLDLR